MPTIIEFSQNEGPFEFNHIIQPGVIKEIIPIPDTPQISIYCKPDDSATLVVALEGGFDARDVIEHIVISRIRYEVLAVLGDNEHWGIKAYITEYGPNAKVAFRYRHQVAS